MLSNWLVWAFWILQVVSVKDYLFKKCEQNGFCQRNRHYGKEIERLGSQYQPRYSIDLETIHFENNNHLDAVVLKQLNDGSYVKLKLDVNIIGDYDFRLRLDEIDRTIPDNIKVNHQRYNEAAQWAFQQAPIERDFKYLLSENDIKLSYGPNMEYEAIISLYPLKVTIVYNNETQLILNNRNFLNLEHYRSKQSEDDVESNDVLPEESRFNAYNDDFADSKGDKVPLGPESVALDVTFFNYSSVYGIPEHADSFSLKDTTDGEPYRLFNVDIFEYETQSKFPMYGSIPFIIGVNSEASVGVFWINAADTYIDIKKTIVSNDERSIEKNQSFVDTHWISENGIIDIILMVKKTSQEINTSYGLLTGFSVLPNLFSLGYHQCRWNYNDEYDVLDVHAKFDEHDIPYDTLWLDIEYTDEKKYFTWNSKQFPDPDTMMSKLDQTGRHLVMIVDPHLKSDYPISDEVIKRGIGIKNSDNPDTYHGHCWPGKSVWIDTLNPQAQDFWSLQHVNGSQLLGYSTNGHLWNDMNEPSIFNGPETTAPKDLIHHGYWEHRSIHNLYGLTFHEATYNALLERNTNQRPFILSRSFFSGSQRTSAMWTGDNMAKWEYLKESIPMILTMNVMGFPFAGADVGGFFGNPSNELLTRWYQTGIWYPFFRAHAHIDSARREPWLAGDEYKPIIVDAIKLRYRLLSLTYTEFWKSSQRGTPIITPLVWHAPNDPHVYDIDNEFYLGNLLVRPVTDENAESVSVYFPCDGSVYYDFFNFEIKYDSCQMVDIEVGLKDIPLFAKSGTILSTKDRSRRSSKLMKYDPYTLYVFLDADGKAWGDLYVDDGQTFGYLNNDWLHVEFEADDELRTLNGIMKHTNDHGFVASLEKVTINKIVLVGSKHTALNSAIVNNNYEADINSNGTVFIIRKPSIPINQSWSIKY